jgi:hypothetical protein
MSLPGSGLFTRSDVSLRRSSFVPRRKRCLARPPARLSRQFPAPRERSSVRSRYGLPAAGLPASRCYLPFEKRSETWSRFIKNSQPAPRRLRPHGAARLGHRPTVGRPCAANCRALVSPRGGSSRRNSGAAPAPPPSNSPWRACSGLRPGPAKLFVHLLTLDARAWQSRCLDRGSDAGQRFDANRQPRQRFRPRGGHHPLRTRVRPRRLLAVRFLFRRAFCLGLVQRGGDGGP